MDQTGLSSTLGRCLIRHVRYVVICDQQTTAGSRMGVTDKCQYIFLGSIILQLNYRFSILILQNHKELIKQGRQTKISNAIHGSVKHVAKSKWSADRHIRLQKYWNSKSNYLTLLTTNAVLRVKMQSLNQEWISRASNCTHMMHLGNKPSCHLSCLIQSVLCSVLFNISRCK